MIFDSKVSMYANLLSLQADEGSRCRSKKNKNPRDVYFFSENHCMKIVKFETHP